MRGRSIFVFILAIFLILIAANFVIAQETQNVTQDSIVVDGQDDTTTDVSQDEIQSGDEGTLEELDKEFEGAELQEGAGITPDSGFYFVEDAILSRFRSDLENKEKKVAEIKSMIQNGNVDAARRALERYNGYADELEKEVDPGKRDEARRSAGAIRNTLREIENEIPADAKDEFFDEILDKEGKIVTAVEIAGKIKELCEQRAKLDPVE